MTPCLIVSAVPVQPWLHVNRQTENAAWWNLNRIIAKSSSSGGKTWPVKKLNWSKGLININQVEIIAFIAQTALTYIFVAIATGNAQKQTVIDQKTDLRTTKEDIMSELKDSRRTLLAQNEAGFKSLQDNLTATIKAEIEQATKEQRKGQ